MFRNNAKNEQIMFGRNEPYNHSPELPIAEVLLT